MEPINIQPAPHLVEYIHTSTRAKRVANRNSAPGGFLKPGSRNTGLASILGKVRRDGASAETLEAIAAAINGTLPDPMPDSEAVAIARSISRYAYEFRLSDNEIGLSRQVAERMAGRFRNLGGKDWAVWTDTHWDTGGGGYLAAQEAVKCILEEFREAARAADDDPPAGLCAAARVKSMLQLSASDERLSIRPSAFDIDANLLNLRNGTLDLKRQKLSSHDPNDLLSKMAAVDYDPQAECPVFDGFLERVQPDSEVRSFLLRLMGYALLGNPVDHRFIVFTGAGRNGKSTFVEALQNVFGDYGATVEPSTFIKQRTERIRTDLARLAGTRFVSTSELNPGEHLDASLVKRLTGGEKVTARFLYGSEFEFQPQFVPVMSTNAMPIVQGGDQALARRLLIVPFGEVIPEHEVDVHLPAKLAREGAGILNRVLEGLVDYQQRGLEIPEVVREESATFMRKSDLIQSFIDDTCIVEARGRITPSNLFDEYRMWCMTGGYHPMTNRQFQEAAAKKLGDQRKSGSQRFYAGWTLLKDATKLTAIG